MTPNPFRMTSRAPRERNKMSWGLMARHGGAERERDCLASSNGPGPGPDPVRPDHKTFRRHHDPADPPPSAGPAGPTKPAEPTGAAGHARAAGPRRRRHRRHRDRDPHGSGVRGPGCTVPSRFCPHRRGRVRPGAEPRAAGRADPRARQGGLRGPAGPHRGRRLWRHAAAAVRAADRTGGRRLEYPPGPPGPLRVRRGPPGRHPRTGTGPVAGALRGRGAGGQLLDRGRRREDRRRRHQGGAGPGSGDRAGSASTAPSTTPPAASSPTGWTPTPSARTPAPA